MAERQISLADELPISREDTIVITRLDIVRYGMTSYAVSLRDLDILDAIHISCLCLTYNLKTDITVSLVPNANRSLSDHMLRLWALCRQASFHSSLPTDLSKPLFFTGRQSEI